ncbi:hypothetical protein BU26DRAFT_522677 [Trematosphaeria pertusa]|uniref:Uncharacterized protein n=1 Tax=Trematosphaeria pertusa TaxID=390896 RepID=A0A6A6I3A4_9PLEO|nr:uncharacterized protein BU26DRAFT_522677 [Trematosphaeria pertusa]KAF2244975.1 hypothetical protein BU26DRAFT_522677 [Trematosphaeria pertusa]
MCQYFDIPVKPVDCAAADKHLVTFRWYILCQSPRGVGTSRHCSVEHARAVSALFGSSRTEGACPACANPPTTVVIKYVNG